VTNMYEAIKEKMVSQGGYLIGCHYCVKVNKYLLVKFVKF